MVNRKNRRYHDRVAGRYDSLYDTAYWRFYRDISWRHLRGFLPETRPAYAADLGCGTGWFGRKLLKSDCDVIFLDPSGAMLEKARASVESSGSRGRTCRYLQGELEDLSGIDDASLDLATAQGDPLSFCVDPLQALHELRRVLKHDAHVVLSVDSRVAGVRALGEAATPRGMLDLLRTGRTRWLAQRSEEAFPMKMFDPDELDGLLRKAGLMPLSRIAKTVLVQRSSEKWLENAETRRELLRAEERVHALPQWFALASHFQVAAKRR